MNFILKLKHWQIFIVLIIGIFLHGFTIESNKGLTITLTVIGGLIYFSWSLFVGHELYQIASDKMGLNYKLFIINSVIWLAAYIIVSVISDGQDITLTGFVVLPVFYIVYAFLHSLMFPARILRSIEKGKKAEIGECIGDFLLVVFLPIGIWFLQPRINKVTADRPDTAISD